MNKVIPLVAVVFAAFYMYRASNIIKSQESAFPKPEPVAAKPTNKNWEPAYKYLIRCLGDIDDILDSIKTPADFEVAKPKMLKRMRQHVALGKEHPNPGFGQLSKPAAKEFSAATNRHTESLIRADKAVPGVVKFFENEIAAVLNSK